MQLSGRRLHLLVVATAALILAAATIAVISGQVPAARLTRDLAVTAHVHPLTGGLSTLGLLGWAAAAGCWTGTALLGHEGAVRRFGWSSALLSVLLCLDDAFMVHDWLAPRVAGIDEKAVLGFIALLTAAWLLMFRRHLLRWPMVVLLTVGLLGGSVAVDLAGDLHLFPGTFGDAEFLVEDGLKALGIASWLGLALTSLAALRDDAALAPIRRTEVAATS